MTGSIDVSDVVGGPDRHIPVMLDEVLACLSPAENLTFVDGTFGAGGYTSALLASGANVLAIDRDPNAIRDGAKLVEAHSGKLILKHGQFSRMQEIAEQNDIEKVDGVVLDIGVSSMQLDEAERGFSFQKDGPLDMRMSQEGVSAADVVNHASQPDLTRIIGLLGEEKKASFASRAIVKARQSEPFVSTLQLAKVVESAIRRGAKDKIHPATRTFQALRIFVNQELHQLGEALFAAERLLKEGGRLVVVTFHSLEDRMVKLFFKDRCGGEQGSRHMPSAQVKPAVFELERKGLLRPQTVELETNPRARSAKLRWGLRTSQTVHEQSMGIFGLPNLASLSSLKQEGR
ncbi:MAG: 16S rRNA (cytosine(1402)-N(4))-methyltransferase RsmH [Pseudomonadota bacterium]